MQYFSNIGSRSVITVYLYWIIRMYITTVFPYTDSCMYWCLAYICEGIFILHIYVAVTSPYRGTGHYTEWVLRIGMKLSAWEEDQFKKFLSENLDVFAWSLIDMPGMNPYIICHKLSTLSEVKPVKHKPRKMNDERLQALYDEVDRLLKADFIRETFYPDWLSNPVPVKKKKSASTSPT